MYRRKPLSRKGWGALLIVLAVFLFYMAVSSTIRYNKFVEDYHLLTTALSYDGKLVEGTIDECIGPVASTPDGGEVYLLTLDNGQIISFETEDDKQIKKLTSSDNNSEKSLKVKFRGKLTRLSSMDESLILETLTSSGINIQQAEKILIPYSIVNKEGFEGRFEYVGAIVCLSIGILLFLPEFGDFVGRTGKKEKGEPDYNIPSRYTYNNSYSPRGQNRNDIGRQYSSQQMNRDNYYNHRNDF